MLQAWGGGTFVLPHMITVDWDGNVWVTGVCGPDSVMKQRLQLPACTAATAGTACAEAPCHCRWSLSFPRPFPSPMLHVSPAPHLALSDVELHQAIKFSPAGEQLLALGKRRESGSGPNRFCKPTQVAVGRNGRIYVSGEPCAPH